MKRLLDQVQTALQQQHLWQTTSALLVAVSGGPDSLCLLHLLWQLQTEGGFSLHVAHLDHGFRGEQSAAEAQFVTDIARQWHLPITVERWDGLNQAQTGYGPQAAARKARYAFLARVAQAVQATAVLLGHHADDQAETVLLHLLNGAGPAGLRGMRAVVPWSEWASEQPLAPDQTKQPMVLRPLLGSTRHQIEAYCASHALTPCDDPSNTAWYYTRSRIRTELLPMLTGYNAQIVPALVRTATICGDDYAYMQQQLDAHWSSLTDTQHGVIWFRQASWQQLPVALQRYALRRAWRWLSGRDEASFEQIEAARAASEQQPGYQQNLVAGVTLRVEQQRFGLIQTSLAQSIMVLPPGYADCPQLTVEERQLPPTGRISIDANWSIVLTFDTTEPLPTDEPWRWWVHLDADRLDGPLLLRRRRPGDRFRPPAGAVAGCCKTGLSIKKCLRSCVQPGPFWQRRPISSGLLACEPMIVFRQTQQPLGYYESYSCGKHQPKQKEIMTLEDDIDTVLLTEEMIQTRVHELGQAIYHDYRHLDNLLLVGVLKGCLMFMVDLARAIPLPLSLDFMAISSYGHSTESSGVVRLLKDLDTDISHRHVLVIEDMIDSGLTLAYLCGQLEQRNPASLRICALLSKPERRQTDVAIDYLGFEVPDKFVVGYGLDYAERYRNLPYIAVLKPEVYHRSFG
ncbi:MAG: hypoxanthine phosphoribosyltransferase [Chloroflexaceae bacterium]|nr:hypoxanthine phosphoribosyltransferase [Chloroflexaceae bacterium]